MKKVGIVGLGDMGSGLAANILKAGFPLKGFDLQPERNALLSECGGVPLGSVKEVGQGSDVVFVMVLNGRQVESVVCGKDGLAETMARGGCVVVTATIKPSELDAIVPTLEKAGVNLIDSPVSGGKAGADGGTLTIMTAASAKVFAEHKDVLEAVGKDIFHVGESPGQGQTVKAALQGLIGATFGAFFEAMVMGTRAGADPRTLYEVFCSSAVGSNIIRGSGENILKRRFEKTGSHIGTMYKDIGITMDLAREMGCAMFTTAAARELFQAGMSRFPEGDNWAIVKFLEEIANVKVEG